MFSKRKVKDANPRRIEVSSVDSFDQSASFQPVPGPLGVIYENVSSCSEIPDNANNGLSKTNLDSTNSTDKEKGSKFSKKKKISARTNGKKINNSNSNNNNNNNVNVNNAGSPNSPKVVCSDNDNKRKKVNAVSNGTTANGDTRSNHMTTSMPESMSNSQSSLAAASQSSRSDISVISTSSGQSAASNRSPTLSSEEIWLKTVESRLDSLSKGSQLLSLQNLKDALRVKESFFVDRFFKLMDKEGSGLIPRQKMMHELRTVACGTQKDKIKFLFDIYNIKGTGKIMKSEVQEVLKNCIHESRIHVSAENLQALTDAIILAADKDKDGKISFDELCALVQRHPTIGDNMAISTSDELKLTSKTSGCCRHLSRRYVANNLKKVVFLGLYLAVNLGLMAVALWQYRYANLWTKTARACGLALNFNCTFVLVLMLRVTMTWLRNTPLVQVIPFDQHIMFHKICGYMILLQAVIHTMAHIGNAFAVADDLKLSVWEILLTTKAGVGWVAGTAYVTGYIVGVVLLVMVVLSLPLARKSGYFEVFYWSHKLYLLFWIVLIIHAGNFWKWFLVPGCVFIVEVITRLKCVKSAYMGKTYIERVCLLPSEVTQLIISRPAGFTFKPGDYVFIQIPAIAKYEWHPFTISSAPEDLGSLWLHIRTVGHWTRTVHQYLSTSTSSDAEQGFGEQEGKGRLVKLRRRASSIAWLRGKSMKARKINDNIMRRVVTRNVKVQVHIDGPYGSPSRHIFEAEHAILIGSGIGVTPFASILQSIVYQYKSKQVRCPQCNYNWCHEAPSTVMNLKKVDFVWINRDQRHFEWFASLLSRLEREQEVEGGIGHILDMHMFMTSALPKTDMKGLGLQLALDLVHQKEKTDLITGLQTRTQAGRPNFDLLFTKIRDNSQSKIKVFFCGSPSLGKVIKDYSHKYGFAFAHEYF